MFLPLTFIQLSVPPCCVSRRLYTGSGLTPHRDRLLRDLGSGWNCPHYFLILCVKLLNSHPGEPKRSTRFSRSKLSSDAHRNGDPWALITQSEGGRVVAKKGVRLQRYSANCNHRSKTLPCEIKIPCPYLDLGGSDFLNELKSSSLTL